MPEQLHDFMDRLRIPNAMPASTFGLNSNYQLPGLIPQLDRLRGLAIILVLFHHVGVVVPAPLHGFAQQGWVGVDLFFVLSGFLITGVLLDNREKTRYFVRFYGHRVLRIWPVYLLLLALVFLVVPAMKLVAGGPFLEVTKEPLGLWAYLLMIQNLFAGILSGSAILRVTWSLAVEEQFYIAWPVLIRYISRRAILPCLLAGIFLAPLVRTWAMHQGFSQVAIYENPLTHGDGLLCGSGVAIWLRSTKTRRRTLLLTGVGLLVLGLCLFLPLSPANVAGSYVSPFVFSAVAMFSTGMLLIALVSEHAGPVFHRLLFMNRTLAFFGFISYGLYLYHFSILRLAASDKLTARVDLFNNSHLTKSLLVALGLVFSVLIAWLSRITFEKAALSKKKIFD
jgi:peptidoglycan/LPS O-acetylase OafA/YrhL